MDDNGFVSFIFTHGGIYRGKTAVGMWIRRRIALKISHRLYRRLYLNAMLFSRILRNITPLAAPAIFAHPFFPINRINDNSVVPHLHGKIIRAFTIWAKCIPEPGDPPAIRNAAHPAPYAVGHIICVLPMSFQSYNSSPTESRPCLAPSNSTGTNDGVRKWHGVELF